MRIACKERALSMDTRNDDDFLIEIKKALMIPETETYADSEIKLHIESCCQLLISIGVAENTVRSDNPLVKGLILIYVKTFFGFKNDGSVKELPSNFDMLVRQLALTSEES